MGNSDSGVDYSYVPNAESVRRRLAIRIVVTLSGAGILIVLARWLTG